VIAVVLRPVLVRPQCKPLLESGWAPSNPSDSKESRSLRTDTKSTRPGRVLIKSGPMSASVPGCVKTHTSGKYRNTIL
jgi:hypothetical protein